MKPVLALLVVLGMLGAEACLTKCPSSTIGFGNSCYYFSSKNTRVTWDAAKRACASKGMHLAVIDNKVEDLFVTSKATKHTMNLWLDGTDQKAEGKWIWSSTGQRITYFNWDKPDSEPDGGRSQNCLGIHKSNRGSYYKWYDLSCVKHKLAYVCESELQVSGACSKFLLEELIACRQQLQNP